jgi:hypothetical protein
MRIRFAPVLGLLLAVSSAALAGAPKAAAAPEKAFDPYQGPAPLVVLLMYDFVADGYSLDFILYEDRTAIFRSRQFEWGGYATLRLDPPQFDALLARVRKPCAEACWKHRVVMNNAADDAPESHLLVRLGGCTDARERNTCQPASGASEAETRIALKTLIESLLQFTPAGARPWKPEYIAVELHPWPQAPGVTGPWPAKWPSLKSRYATPTGDGGYRVYLPGSQRGVLDALREKSEGGVPVVTAEGMKWRLWVRQVFPSQPVWMRAFGLTP